MAAEVTPMMTTPIRISISVKPRTALGARLRAIMAPAPLLAEVPVADVGIDALAADYPISSEAEQVVLLAVRARIHVLIVVAPGILADPLEVAAGSPVLDGRISRLGHKGRQPLLGGWVFRVVQPVHGERGLQALDVALGLADLRRVDLANNLRNDEGGQQADDDHDHHDLDEGEATRAPPATASANLV